MSNSLSCDGKQTERRGEDLKYYLQLDSHKSIPVFRRADEGVSTDVPWSQRFNWMDGHVLSAVEC
jgi:hypothetical protein